MSPSRIDELRRRVQNDPASIAFAQLAEEYRRSGQTDEAVRICREGLTRHPGYLSARVTLGRALLDLGQLAEARGEFEFVVAEAPENLAAVRGLAEICHRDGQAAEALTYYQRALALARHDPEIEEIVQQLTRQVGAASAGPSNGLSFEEAHQELLSAAERVPLAAPQPASTLPVRPGNEGSTAPFDFDRLVAALGSPTAPPQLEAAVEGRAATVAPIELPDTADLGPNPFAALEAELRAHEPTPVTDAAPARPWDAVADAAPAEVDDAVAAVAVEPAGESVAAAEPALEPEPVAAVDATDDVIVLTTSAGADLPAVEMPHVLSVEDVLADTMLADTVELVDDASAPVMDAVNDAAEMTMAATDTAPAEVSAPVATAAEPAAPAPAASAAAGHGEDVLDDLESWLNTLHDRSTE